MRPLRPDRLFPLDSGLWAVDATQPVAVVLDPGGAVRTLVSWERLPPPPRDGSWPAPVVLGEGAGLWVQQDPAGALVRVTEDGVAAAAWTGGLVLATCGPGTAWCAPRPPLQELVQGRGARPVRGRLQSSELLRVDEHGRCSRVRVPGPVRSLRSGEDALLVEVDQDTWSLRHLGVDTYEVVRTTRWLALAWDQPVPEKLTATSHARPEDDDRTLGCPGHQVRDGGQTAYPWYHAGADWDKGESVVAAGMHWRVGWPMQTSGSRPGGAGAARDLTASAHTEDGTQLIRWDLGPGRTLAVAPLDGALAVSLDRQPWPSDTAPGEVVLLDPAAPHARVLLRGDAVDIGDRCWPLVQRPLEVASYLDGQLRAHSSLEKYWTRADRAEGPAQPPVVTPLAEGMSDVRTAVVGPWPRTQLEWTFDFAPLPGLRLRRRVPLFDEVGRISPPEFADIHLMEDLDTRTLPPTSAAADGILDI